MYNCQNDRIWAANRIEANEKDGTKPHQSFLQKVMVWLGACSTGVIPTIIIEEGIMDHKRDIDEVIPISKRYGDDVSGTDWTYQQDGTKAHIHHLYQQWCRDNIRNFFDKDRWPPNRPDLNPLNYSLD